MCPLLKVGQVVKGKFSSYNVLSALHESVFLAKNESGSKVVLKAVRGHWRLHNEAEILTRFQSRTSFIRPLVDEIQEPSDPAIIFLAHLDSDLRAENKRRNLSQSEIKRVARCVLEALQVLHKEDFVHTDIKSDNVLINYGSSDARIQDVQLADFGGTVAANSMYAKRGETVGAPIWRSPEVLLGIPWGTPTDIWLFGTMVISLIVGNDYHIFDPGNDGVSFEDPMFEFEILMKHLQFFGPFKETYCEIADEDAMSIIAYAMETIPRERIKAWWQIEGAEIREEDDDFLQKVMKLDPRDRPTAEELLADEWFNGYM